MLIDLLDTPLRISWRLAPEAPPGNDEVLLVAGRLVEAGVFHASLDGRPLAHPAVQDILRLLADGGIQVVLNCAGTAAELNALVAGLPIGKIYLDAAPALVKDDFTGLSGLLETIRSRGFEPGLLLVPRHENVAGIPRVFEFCRAHRVAKFKLPNVDIGVSVKNLSDGGLVTCEDLQRLGRDLAPDAASGLQLEVHDLFLWELLCPESKDGRSGYGGCQAANSLGHIDDKGNLFPCSSWPEPLGSLLAHSIEALWALPERRRVREEIAKPPEGCRGCRDWTACFGGCRGLARTFNRHHGGRDPMCREPRS
jgi:GeoRSP system SPASM domain protein